MRFFLGYSASPSFFFLGFAEKKFFLKVLRIFDPVSVSYWLGFACSRQCLDIYKNEG